MTEMERQVLTLEYVVKSGVYDVDVKCGKKTMYYDNSVKQWVVLEDKRYARRKVLLIQTDSEQEAIAVLVN